MAVLINGEFGDQVSALDRACLYGQSVFETIAVVHGKPALLDRHLFRLEKGCNALSIPLNINDIEKDLYNLLHDIRLASSESMLDARVVRVTVTMGQGGRGYANPVSPSPTCIISDHDYPKHPSELYRNGIELGISDVTLAHQPLLAGIKHGNRLEQVIARSRWQSHWHEALLLDGAGNVVEGTQSNVIILKDGRVLTPRLDQCGVNGVMKNWVLEHLKDTGFSCEAVRLSVADIIDADEVIMTNSVIGVWPVKQFESRRFEEFSIATRLSKRLQQNEIIPNY